MRWINTIITMLMFLAILSMRSVAIAAALGYIAIAWFLSVFGVLVQLRMRRASNEKGKNGPTVILMLFSSVTYAVALANIHWDQVAINPWLLGLGSLIVGVCVQTGVKIVLLESRQFLPKALEMNVGKGRSVSLSYAYALFLYGTFMPFLLSVYFSVLNIERNTFDLRNFADPPFMLLAYVGVSSLVLVRMLPPRRNQFYKSSRQVLVISSLLALAAAWSWAEEVRLLVLTISVVTLTNFGLALFRLANEAEFPEMNNLSASNIL